MELFLLRGRLHLPKLWMRVNVAATATQGNARDAKIIHRHALGHLVWRAAVLDWRPLATASASKPAQERHPRLSRNADTSRGRRGELRQPAEIIDKFTKLAAHALPEQRVGELR